MTKVAFVGQNEYFGCHYENDLDDLFSVKKFQLRFGANYEYYRELIEYSPDILIAFRGELMPHSVVKQISGTKIAISTEPMPKVIGSKTHYTRDSLERFRNFLPIFERDYDYIFHYDEASESFFTDQGVNVSGFFPLPIAARTYKPLRNHKSRQVLFFGRSTAHREEILGPLKRDFDVLHLAHGWPGEKPHEIETFLQCVDSFRLCLNLHAEDELSWEPRVQLMLACGCTVVSEPLSPNRFLLPGQHFYEATGVEAIYQACHSLLEDSDSAARVARGGHEYVVRELSARRMWPDLFQKVRAGGFPAPYFERSLLDLDPLDAMLKYDGFEHLEEWMRLRHA